MQNDEHDGTMDTNKENGNETTAALVAYLLDEASAEERARVEKLLAASPELRAERERLEATIGLVKALDAPRPELSSTARASLATATTLPGGKVIQGPWYRRPQLQAAAALLLVGSVGLAYVFRDSLAPDGRAAGVEVAQSDAAERADRRNTHPMAKSGQLGDEFGRNARLEADSTQEFDAERKELLNLGYRDHDFSEEALAQAREQLEGLESHAYMSGGVTDEAVELQAERNQLESLGYASDDAFKNALELRSRLSKSESVATDSATQSAPDADASASLGRQEPSTQTGKKDLADGSLRGAGDAVAPSAEYYLASTPESVTSKPVGGASPPPPPSGIDAARAPKAEVLRALSGASPGGPPPTSGAESTNALAPAETSAVELARPATSGKLGDGGGIAPGVEVSNGSDPEAPTLSKETARLLDNLGYSDARRSWSRSDRGALGSDVIAAEDRMLARMGLTRDRLGDALQALGYLSADDDIDLESPEGLRLRQRAAASELLRQRLDALLEQSLRRPGESLDAMFFRHWGTRPFVATASDPQSTFSIDVDTASYTLARGMLLQGYLPQRDQVRVEEFVNYFDPEVPAPTEGTFAIATELAPSPFKEGSTLLRAVVKAKDVIAAERQPVALTFVIDTSGSMSNQQRIGLVQESLRLLLTRLDGRDRLAIVGFSSDARVILAPTPADRRGLIGSAIESLSTGGSTNADAGVTLGYTLAAQAFDANYNNRVVLLSDGVANTGDTEQAAILAKVTEQRSKGIYLNTIGVGIGNHNDALLEQLADKGDGVCDYVDSPAEARRAFVENFSGAFETIARDVKIQVEFDPAKVKRYRLLGYENRAIADREFRNDKVDAGEVNAGRSATAIFELEGVDLSEGDIGIVRVRYKEPFGPEVNARQDAPAREIIKPVASADSGFSFASASVGFRKSVLVAELAEILRRSVHVRGHSFERLGKAIARLAQESQDPDFREFAALFERNRASFQSCIVPASEADGLIDELKYVRFELERERAAEGVADVAVIKSLAERIEELTRRLRELAFGGPAPDELQSLRDLGYVDDK